MSLVYGFVMSVDICCPIYRKFVYLYLKSRFTHMKKPLFLMLLSLGAISCADRIPDNSRDDLMEASRQELATALAERDQLLELVKEISEGMDEIKHLENIMSISGTPSPESRATHAALVRDIARVRATLRQRREQLEALEAKLRESELFSNSLADAIEVMKRQLDSQTREIETLRSRLREANEHIADLNYAVDSLNVTLGEVTGRKDSAERSAMQIESEMNRCHYVVASKNSLREHRILQTGFLRKTRLMDSDFDPDFFVTTDRRTLRSVDCGDSKPKVLTRHPADSYRLTESAGEWRLDITDPARFWQLTGYLVVQTD